MCFSSEFAYFIGGNMDEVTKIQALSVEAGIPNYVHNTFGISSKRVNLGLTPKSDGFVQLFRFLACFCSKETRVCFDLKLKKNLFFQLQECFEICFTKCQKMKFFQLQTTYKFVYLPQKHTKGSKDVLLHLHFD